MPSEQLKKIRDASPEYLRPSKDLVDAHYDLLLGNPAFEPFTIVLLSCPQQHYKRFREELAAIAKQHEHLSLHLVPCVCDTYAILRGSMPQQTWLWQKIVTELAKNVGPNEIDLVIAEVELKKFRWRSCTYDDDLGKLELKTIDQDDAPKAAELIQQKRARLVGNDTSEGELVYALITRPQGKNAKYDNTVIDDLMREDQIRDVFVAKPQRTHLDGGAGKPIKVPAYNNGIFARGDFLSQVGAIAVFGALGNGESTLQFVFDWRRRFEARHGLAVELMPAAVEHEGIEYDFRRMAAEASFGVMTADEVFDDPEAPPS